MRVGGKGGLAERIDGGFAQDAARADFRHRVQEKTRAHQMRKRRRGKSVCRKGQTADDMTPPQMRAQALRHARRAGKAVVQEKNAVIPACKRCWRDACGAEACVCLLFAEHGAERAHRVMADVLPPSVAPCAAAYEQHASLRAATVKAHHAGLQRTDKRVVFREACGVGGIGGDEEHNAVLPSGTGKQAAHGAKKRLRLLPILSACAKNVQHRQFLP